VEPLKKLLTTSFNIDKTKQKTKAQQNNTSTKKTYKKQSMPKHTPHKTASKTR
jgi:hypothetical protein